MAQFRRDPRVKPRYETGAPAEYKTKPGEVRPCRRCGSNADTEAMPLIGIYEYGMRFAVRRSPGVSGIDRLTDENGDPIVVPYVTAVNTHKACDREYARNYRMMQQAQRLAEPKTKPFLFEDKRANAELRKRVDLLERNFVEMLAKRTVVPAGPTSGRAVRPAQPPPPFQSQPFNPWAATRMPNGGPSRWQPLGYNTDVHYTTDAEHKKILEMASRPEDPDDPAPPWVPPATPVVVPEAQRMNPAQAPQAPATPSKSRVYMGEELE